MPVCSSALPPVKKHITVEYCVQEDDGAIRWVQKTVLMTQTTMFDPEINAEMPMVTAIILLQDTSQMHARDEQENARLQAAFDEMRVLNRTKNRISLAHESRYPDTAQRHYRSAAGGRNPL